MKLRDDIDTIDQILTKHADQRFFLQGEMENKTTSESSGNLVIVKKDSVPESGSSKPQLSPAISQASTVVSEDHSETSTLIEGSPTAGLRKQKLPPAKTVHCLPWKDGRCHRGDGCLYIHDPEVIIQLTSINLLFTRS
jgi:hypothetical protein